MTTKIGGIVIDIDARLTKMEAALQKADKDFSRFERNVKAQGSSIERSLAGIDKGFGFAKASVLGFVASLSVGAVAAFGKKILSFADDLATAADQAGINVERFQTLREGFRVLEIDSDAVDKALKRLTSTLGDVQNGVEDEATKALEKMGVAQKVLSGEIRTTDQLLDGIAAASKNYATEASFTSDVVNIFGRRVGVEMAAALRDGGEALHQIEERFRASGAVIDSEMIDKLAEANEKIEAFQVQVEQRLTMAGAKFYDFAKDAGTAIDSLYGLFDGPSDNWLDTLSDFFGKASSDFFSLSRFIHDVLGMYDDARNTLQLVKHDEFSLAAAAFPGLRAKKSEEQATFDRRFQLARIMAGDPLADFQREPSPTRGPTFNSASAGGRSGARRSGGGRSRAAAPKRDDFWENKNTSLAFSAEHDTSDAFRAMGLDIAALQPVERSLEAISADLVKMQGEIPDIGSMLSEQDRQELLRFSDTFNHSLSQGLADAIVYGDDLGDTLVNTFQRAAAAMLESGILNLLTGGSQGTSFSTMFGNLFGGGRASGGPVDPSRFYVVGENGPEIFSPGTHGSIIPNFSGTAPGMMRGGNSAAPIVVHQHYSFEGVAITQEQFIRGLAMTKSETIRTFQDMRSRGAL